MSPAIDLRLKNSAIWNSVDGGRKVGFKDSFLNLVKLACQMDSTFPDALLSLRTNSTPHCPRGKGGSRSPGRLHSEDSSAAATGRVKPQRHAVRPRRLAEPSGDACHRVHRDASRSGLLAEADSRSASEPLSRWVGRAVVWAILLLSLLGSGFCLAGAVPVRPATRDASPLPGNHRLAR